MKVAMQLFLASIVLVIVLFPYRLSAQTYEPKVVTDINGRVGIGTVQPDGSAVLELFGTDGGVLLPRLTTPQRDAIVLPATGLLIYNNDIETFEYNIGTPVIPHWVSLLYQNNFALAAWGLEGNAVSGTEVLGTTNAEDLNIITDSITRININAATGNIGIGSSSTVDRLSVAGDISTTTHYDIAGERVLSVPGTSNTFAGIGTGGNLTTGFSNAFVGTNAGAANTNGSRNVFIGPNAGTANTSGGANTYIGDAAGFSNITGDFNTAVGSAAGFLNISGELNCFFGNGAGLFNNGTANSFYGQRAGNANTTGNGNSFLGEATGQYSQTGSDNTFLGRQSGLSSISGDSNVVVGAYANVADGLSNAIAIGTAAVVTQSNAMVLGNGVDVGIGTSAPRAELDVSGTGAMIVPVGTTAERPATPVQGMVRFNTTTNVFEGYDGASWVNLN